jgi:hypothetical protein
LRKGCFLHTGSSIAFFDYRLAFTSFLMLSMSDLQAIGAVAAVEK